MTASTASQLPTLDLSRFDGAPRERAAFLGELREKARNHGFFYVTGHGIAPDFVAEILAAARRFFALPESEKLAIEMVNSPHFRGYTRAGWEHTRGEPDWREQLDVGAERPALPFDPQAPAWRRLQGPNQWPETLPELRPTLLRWQREANALSVRLIRAFSAALGAAEDVFEPIYADTPQHLTKIIRYPGREATASEQGVGAHKDSGFITILLQDRQGGLQVETENGWVDAVPVPGTFIVNIGELFEMASNGYLRATVHRVVTPPAGTDRLSVAFFLGARLDSTVPVLTLAPELAAQARGVTQDPLNPLFRDVGQNYMKGRLRSHPDVARRHHADLLDPAQRVDGKAVASAY